MVGFASLDRRGGRAGTSIEGGRCVSTWDDRRSGAGRTRRRGGGTTTRRAGQSMVSKRHGDVNRETLMMMTYPHANPNLKRAIGSLSELAASLRHEPRSFPRLRHPLP